jgi:hypothetical protein
VKTMQGSSGSGYQGATDSGGLMGAFQLLLHLRHQYHLHLCSTVVLEILVIPLQLLLLFMLMLVLVLVVWNWKLEGIGCLRWNSLGLIGLMFVFD